MSHLVINYQTRRQYVLIFIAAIIFSFGLGYWFGYSANSSADLAATLTHMEGMRSQDDQAAGGALQTPYWSEEKPAATASVPAAKPLAKPAAPTAAQPATVAKPVVLPAPAVIKPAPVAALAPVAPVANTPAATKPVIETAPTNAPEPESSNNESITNTSLSADAANTLYVVQAGVFDGRENAMKLVNELNAKGFEAYVSEFIASSGEIKFNVRFGRGSDRDLVQKRLTRFRQLYTTSAYIVTLDK